jgi:Domain of unknown function (DUF1963)
MLDEYSSVHPEFNLEKWTQDLAPLKPISDFELNRSRKDISSVYDPNKMRMVQRDKPPTDQEVLDNAWLYRLFSDTIWSPSALAERERTIAQMPQNLVPTEFDTTDIFVFGLGEPENPEATKIGGLPYMPTDTPWPMFNEEPMTFLAQICFLDSKDLFESKLPGDVLLIFIPDEYALFESGMNKDDATLYKWVQVKDQELFVPDSIPTQSNPPTPCFGVRHRMKEYISDEPMYWRTESTKIGGSPAWIQGHDDYIKPDTPFIATLGCINYRANGGPLVNASKDDLTKEQRDDLWMYLDSGQLNIFINSDGTTTGKFESY